MSKRFSPLARLCFSSDGIKVFGSTSLPSLTPNMCLILELFVHHQSIKETHLAYASLVQRQRKRLPSLPEVASLPTSAKALLLVGDRVFLTSDENVDRAYELAYKEYLSDFRANGTLGHKQHKSLRANGDPLVHDLTVFSRRHSAVTVLLAKRWNIAENCYPPLNIEQFAKCVDDLFLRGLLTIPVDKVDFGDFKRYIPFCPHYGYTRGTPIDRYYLDRFIDEVKQEVHGEVLEIGGLPGNAEKYGFVNATHYGVMDLDKLRGADFIGDAHDPSANSYESLDSIVAFNVLEHCERPWVVVKNMYEWLKPKGAVFCMVPNVQRVHRAPQDYWRILPDAFCLLFEAFRITRLRTYGNLLTSIAAFSGIAVEELPERDLVCLNPEFPVATCISAVKDVHLY